MGDLSDWTGGNKINGEKRAGRSLGDRKRGVLGSKHREADFASTLKANIPGCGSEEEELKRSA